MSDYSQWIKEYLEKNGDVSGRCFDAVQEMQEKFPELFITWGHVMVDFGQSRAFELSHWWCETETGEVFDPTASQFHDRILEYHPLRRSREDWCD